MIPSRGTAPAPFPDPVYVTRPLVPDLQTFVAELQGIWDRRWLTNIGPVHDAFEQALCNYLHFPRLSLVNSGTTALLLALRAYQLSGEVITTPLTSPATINAITWCGLTPVFADVDPVSLTVDPAAFERAVTPRTTAIVGVHVYGMPCDVAALQEIASLHGLRVIYDGAHAFGTELAGKPILEFGDATTLSFHATKLFTTAEGGAVAVQDDEFKRRIDLLRNLGIQDEATVALPGINGRMNELAAALGIANLQIVDVERRRREAMSQVYMARLRGITGLSQLDVPSDVRGSQQYFVLRIDREVCACSRDELWHRLKAFNVFARRYFNPLCSNLPFYRDLPSADPRNLPVANRAEQEVLCLPLYGSLGVEAAARICDIIRHIVRA